MSVELYRGSPGKFDSRTLDRKTLSRWTRRSNSLRHGVARGVQYAALNTNTTRTNTNNNNNSNSLQFYSFNSTNTNNNNTRSILLNTNSSNNIIIIIILITAIIRIIE